MKFTKNITVKNIYDDIVEVQSIPYSVALSIMILMEEKHLIMNQITKRFLEIMESRLDLSSDEELKRLEDIKNNYLEKEHFLRDKYDYYYAGLDNLDISDRDFIKNKYERRA